MNLPQIQLVPVKALHKRALKRGKSELKALLGFDIPEGWPHFPEAFEALDDDTEMSALWPAYFFVSLSKKSLLGNGGFASPPNALGEVEIGYEIAPIFQNKGFATAAASALRDLAFSRPEVNAVVAHTLAEENASNAVLKKIGMSKVAELLDQEVGMVWKWRVQRSP